MIVHDCSRYTKTRLLLLMSFYFLTHLCRIYFPILIKWISQLSILGLLHGIFYSNFKRNLCLQTVESLIRRRDLWRLIWFCTVCLCDITKASLKKCQFHIFRWAYIIFCNSCCHGYSNMVLFKLYFICKEYVNYLNYVESY